MRSILKEWGGMGEMVAATGVILSLVFVGYELNKNNEIMQASTDNLLYELQDSMYADLETNSDLIAIQVKLANGEELEELPEHEAWQYSYHLWRFLGLWELAFDRYHDDLLSEEKWTAWNASFESEIVNDPVGLPKELWESGRNTYGHPFASHVDAAYLRMSRD